MTRRKKDPLRTLTEEERNWLERISRAHSEPAAHVARAKEILAVADGQSYTKAAQMAGTNTWSLTTLQKALRKAEDGLPEISTERIWVILQEAGFRWQKSRSWCETGQVIRKRKRGVVTITDPDATPKKK
jgi:transposase